MKSETNKSVTNSLVSTFYENARISQIAIEMNALQAQDTFLPIIEEVINVKGSNIKSAYDETIVLLGQFTSEFLVFAKTLFRDYAFPEMTKSSAQKGFQGAFTYILLTKTGTERVAIIYRTEFYKANIEIHVQVNKAQKLKVLLFASYRALEAESDLQGFEYLHKELESFLTHVRHDSRSVGLIVAAAKAITAIDVSKVLRRQAYQSGLLTLLSSREQRGRFANLQLVQIEIVQKRLVLSNRPEVKRFIFDTIKFVETERGQAPGAYFYHKHYLTMDSYTTDFNRRLDSLAKMIKTRLVPVSKNLKGGFHVFMDGILRIKFDPASGFPLNLRDHLTIALNDNDREFGQHLYDHRDLLLGSLHLTGHADPQYRYQDMDYIEHNVRRYEALMPTDYMTELISSVNKMKTNIRLMIQLTQVDRKLAVRPDKPSRRLHANIVKAVTLLLEQINGILDVYKKKFAFIWTGAALTRFRLMLDLYKAELKFIFVNANKMELKVTPLNRPIDIFGLAFDKTVEKMIIEIHDATKTEISDGMKDILTMARNEFLRKHEVMKNQSVERIVEVLQIMKKLKMSIQPLTGEYLTKVHVQEWNASNSTLALNKLKTRIDRIHRRFADYQLAYHRKVWTPSGDWAGIWFDPNQTGPLKTTINRHYADMIANITDNIVQMLVRNKTSTVDEAVTKLDRHLERGLRLKYADYELTDEEDWESWRQQTSQTFYRLHRLQELPQSFYKFKEDLSLMFSVHDIDVPMDWSELEEVVGAFDALQTEMDGYPINPISEWGRNIAVSKLYVRNSGSMSGLCSTLLLACVLLRKLF